MSITQEQYDALKPGDRVRSGDRDGTVVGVLAGDVWVRIDDMGSAYVYGIRHIDAIIPHAPHPVAWMNFYASVGEVGAKRGSRQLADEEACGDRTHVITIYSDGTTTTEAVS